MLTSVNLNFLDHLQNLTSLTLFVDITLEKEVKLPQLHTLTLSDLNLQFLSNFTCPLLTYLTINIRNESIQHVNSITDFVNKCTAIKKFEYWGKALLQIQTKNMEEIVAYIVDSDRKTLEFAFHVLNSSVQLSTFQISA